MRPLPATHASPLANTPLPPLSSPSPPVCRLQLTILTLRLQCNLPQALLVTQRDLTSQVQRLLAARAGSKTASFTFRKKGSTIAASVAGASVNPMGSERGSESESGSATVPPSVTVVDATASTSAEATTIVIDAGGRATTRVAAHAIETTNDAIVASASVVVEYRSDVEVRIRRLDALQQVRIRGCENVTFKLYYAGGPNAPDNDKVVVEASTGLTFGFYDEDGGGPIPRRTVRDFGWLKAGPSPNVRYLSS